MWEQHSTEMSSSVKFERFATVLESESGMSAISHDPEALHGLGDALL